MQESIFFAAYKPPENRLIVFADDGQPRWITCSTMVDYDTVAAGDKFGNVFINRLSRQISEEVDNDPTGAGVLHEKAFLAGAPHKTSMLAHFNVGDILTSIHKVALVAGGRDVLLYTGFSGTVGILVPFVSSEDVDLCVSSALPCRTLQVSEFAQLPNARDAYASGGAFPHRSRSPVLPGMCVDRNLFAPLLR